MLQSILHYGFHFLFPALIAWVFFRKEWKKAYLIMLATMLVDLDHLLANPIFDPSRCSIGFHPLHSYYAILIYIALLLFPKSRIIAIGLLLHMITDYLDCNFVSYFISQNLQQKQNWTLSLLFQKAISLPFYLALPRKQNSHLHTKQCAHQ